MKKYRPKKFVMYSYGTIYRAYVSCHPKSKWEFGGIFGGSIVKLSNGHTTIYVDKDQFEKNWIEVI